MAGSLPMTKESARPSVATEDQWHHIRFSRFFTYPDPSLSSKCPSPLQRRSRRARGTWISTSSPGASLHIINDSSTSDAILAVYFQEKILEEHYISKLQFTWPQVSCVYGYPTRGSRILLVSYQDSAGQIQKFALQFSSNYEVERFINGLKDTLKDKEDAKPLNTDLGFEISSGSEFISSNIHPSRTCEEELDIIASVDAYTPEMPPRLTYEVEQPSYNQDTYLKHNVEGIYPALPPSFTSLIANCCSEVKEAPAQPTVSEEVDLKSLIASYMEDSSFQDMLIKVEQIINEVGGDFSL